jgi:hypothetical protein
MVYETVKTWGNKEQFENILEENDWVLSIIQT